MFKTRLKASTLILSLILCSKPMLAMGAFETPPQHAMPYSATLMPPQLPRDEIQWAVQTAANGLYGQAFVDLGDMTDFMHGHVVFRDHQDSFKPLKDLTDISWLPNWSELEALAILFHTQEYDNLRRGTPYIGPQGPLDGFNRNWLLLLKDNIQGKRGELRPATEFMEKPSDKKILTIRTEDLKHSLFGQNPYDWEYSFYFFRVSCEQADAKLSAEQQKTTSLISVSLNGERYCLNLQSFFCRNHPEASACQVGPGLEVMEKFPPRQTP